MIDVDDMRAFQQVACSLSFSAAGRTLSVRKSAVSRSIQRLEEALGVRLFERTTREVVLTEAGRALLAGFDDVVARIDDLFVRATDLASRPRGRLRVTAGIGFGMEVLTELIPEFSAAYPDIAVSLDLTSRTVDLVGEQVDVAIRMGPMHDSSLKTFRLGAITCQLCASAEYVERRGQPTTLDELHTHDLLAIPRPDNLPRRWCLRDQDGRQHAFEPPVRLTANDPVALHRMVLNGAGIAATANYLVRPHLETGALIRIMPDWTVPAVDVSLVLPAGRERSPVARAFVDFLRSKAGNNPRWFDA